MQIREVTIQDAERLNRLLIRLVEETKFLLFEPGERTLTVEAQQKRLAGVLAEERHTIFVVEHEGDLVGQLGIRGGRARRNQHQADISIGILQDYVGQGLGTRLFETAERWARENGLLRLELTVMTHNERAIALYRKMGFVIEGTSKNSLCIDGEFVDEYNMAKWLPDAEALRRSV